jgi:hypothetical protein
MGQVLEASPVESQINSRLLAGFGLESSLGATACQSPLKAPHIPENRSFLCSPCVRLDGPLSALTSSKC